MKRIALALLLSLGVLAAPAAAAPLVAPCTELAVTPNAACNPVNSGNPMPVTTQATTPAAGTAGAGYPPGAIPITGVGTGTTGAVSATLAANATRITYLCTVTVSALGGTATIGPITITNLAGNTFTLQMTSTATGNFFSQNFQPCIPTSAVNTAIVATTTADGTASAVDVNLAGFQQ